MKAAERESSIRRILVALDASPHSLAALEAGAALAARLQAELLGLFVEDINLLRFAALPFAREVGLFSATLRRLESREVEWQLRAQAERARRALTLIAGQSQLRASFRVARGPVAAQVLAAAAEADLVTLGRVGWSAAAPGRLGSTVRAVLASAQRPVLILQPGVRLQPSVLVVYDGSPAARAALAVAVHLVRADDHRLSILIVADTPDEAQRRQAEADDWLRARGLVAHSRWLGQVNVRGLAGAARREGSSVVVLPGEILPLEGEGLSQLLKEVDCSVLLVKELTAWRSSAH